MRVALTPPQKCLAANSDASRPCDFRGDVIAREKGRSIGAPSRSRIRRALHIEGAAVLVARAFVRETPDDAAPNDSLAAHPQHGRTDVPVRVAGAPSMRACHGK